MVVFILNRTSTQSVEARTPFDSRYGGTVLSHLNITSAFFVEHLEEAPANMDYTRTTSSNQDWWLTYMSTTSLLQGNQENKSTPSRRKGSPHE